MKINPNLKSTHVNDRADWSSATFCNRVSCSPQCGRFRLIQNPPQELKLYTYIGSEVQKFLPEMWYYHSKINSSILFFFFHFFCGLQKIYDTLCYLCFNATLVTVNSTIIRYQVWILCFSKWSGMGQSSDAKPEEESTYLTTLSVGSENADRPPFVLLFPLIFF